MSMGQRNRGFTLVELLVAISVLAIIAVLGWRGLDTIVRARVSLNSELDRTRGLQLTFAQMQSDCQHIVASADIGGRTTLASQTGSLTLVRTVFADNQPSRMQVIAYRVRNGTLTRRESIATRDLAALDASWSAIVGDMDDTQPVVLNNDISRMAIRSWGDSSKLWRTGTDAGQNPSSPGTKETLTGVEVTLTLQDRAVDMVKVLLLGAV